MDNQTTIREKYGSLAQSVTESKAAACCDPAMRCCDPITKDLYSDIEDARTFLTEAGISVDEIAPQVEGKFFSAFIRATKPEAPCCAPGCCDTVTVEVRA